MTFPVYDMTSSIADRPESLGSKEKFWVIPDPKLGLAPTPHLFKIGRSGTGENWSEKAAFEIAKLMELPCATYHLATCRGVQGTISERMFPADGGLVLANLILSRLDPDYDDTLRFKQARHKLSLALNFVGTSVLKPPLNTEQQSADLTARHYFIGYLVLDALIGNTDRHHENWGVVVVPRDGKNTYHLAATFDHASSMGRELTDQGRIERMTTNDTRANLSAYATRCRSAFYDVGTNPHLLTNAEVLSNLIKSHPKSTKFWAEKVAKIDEHSLKDIFNRIDKAFMTTMSADFAMQLVKFNQTKIQEIANGA